MSKRIEKPIISILMAVYNAQEFLEEAIDSVIEQTYLQWELICINDGSTDNSLNILHQCQGKDPRIIVVDRPHGGTASGARNAGLDIASGDYIAMLDSDDKIEKTYLEKLILRRNETQADIVISSTSIWNFNNNTISYSLTGVSGDTTKILSGREAFKLSLHWKIGGIGLHDAKILKKIKYCEIGLNGDEYTTRVLFLHAAKVVFSDAIYYYRINDKSSTRKFSVNHFSSIITKAMLVTLIRQNKFERNIFIEYREEVIVSLFSNYAQYIKKRKLLTKNEKSLALKLLTQATKHLCKEFFLPPFSILSIYRIINQLVKKFNTKFLIHRNN